MLSDAVKLTKQLIVLPLLIALLPTLTACASGAAASTRTTDAALIRLAADRIDSTLAAVAASARATADEYVIASRAAVHTDTGAGAVDPAYWRSHSHRQGNTVGYQTWAGALDSPPAYQADTVAWYGYQTEPFGATAIRQLDIFRRMTPVVRAAYHAFDFSWSYFTTADGMLLIYPYLPLAQAVNNDPPTRQVFYTAVDPAQGRGGWTPPYLDLAGAGMMITASYPAADGDRLLGVASHDITLNQLATSVLQQLIHDQRQTAFLIDGTGRVIAVSDRQLMQQIDQDNRQAGDAVVSFRGEAALRQAGLDSAVPSPAPWLNELGDQLLIRAASRSASTTGDSVITFTRGSRQLLASRIEATGWYVVLVSERTSD